MNKDTYEAFPSMETIAKDAGISKPTVIKHLVANGDITVRKEGRRNIYKFNPLSKNFEMFTYKFMLTTQQRIYIILTHVQRRRRVCILRFGISRANWIKCGNYKLENKGVLQILDTGKKDEISGCPIQLKLFDLTKICTLY